MNEARHCCIKKTEYVCRFKNSFELQKKYCRPLQSSVSGHCVFQQPDGTCRNYDAIKEVDSYATADN